MQTKTGVSDPLSNQLKLRAEARKFDRSRNVSDDDLRDLKRVPARRARRQFENCGTLHSNRKASHVVGRGVHEFENM